MTRLWPLALLLAAGPGCTSPDPMQQQPRYDPYEESRFFADKRTMRTPPEDTVPQERRRAREPLTTGRSGGGFVEQLPVPLTKDLMQRGRERFEIYCSPCHGLLANGQGPVARIFAQRPPPALILRGGVAQDVTASGVPFVPSRARSDATGLRFPPGYYFAVMTEGYGLMGSYAGELSVEDRWAVVAYLRALAFSQNAPVASAPPDIQRRLQEEKP